jgi:hypothetical protein
MHDFHTLFHGGNDSNIRRLNPSSVALWSSWMSNPRAARYRRLALQEPDIQKAKLLQLIADEADRGVLCTAELIKPKVHSGEKASA